MTDPVYVFDVRSISLLRSKTLGEEDEDWSGNATIFRALMVRFAVATAHSMVSTIRTTPRVMRSTATTSNKPAFALHQIALSSATRSYVAKCR